MAGVELVFQRRTLAAWALSCLGAILLLFSAAMAQPAPAAGAQAGGPSEAAADYQLGAADKIRVIVFGEESLSGEFVVSGNGKVSLPLIGEVQAAGLTVRAFQTEVQNALKAGYLKDPRVSAEVLNYRPYYIMGEVSSPGKYPYTDDLTVVNAVATAGGYTYRANKGKVYIKRAGELQEREYRLTADMRVMPGDTIRVPERLF
jgi:polysaccharide export outer membrane protein